MRAPGACLAALLLAALVVLAAGAAGGGNSNQSGGKQRAGGSGSNSSVAAATAVGQPGDRESGSPGTGAQNTSNPAPRPPPVPASSPKPPPPGPPARLSEADYAALAQGVGRVEASAFHASRHYLTGPALAIVADAAGAPIVSASRLGRGRVLHFGHQGMLREELAPSGLGRLLRNAASWAAGGKLAGVRVAGATAWAADGLAAALEQQNSLRFRSVGVVDHASISRRFVDVYIMNGQDLAVRDYAPRIQKFVREGGGLLVGSEALYWAHTKLVARHPSNVLLAPMGIGVADDMARFDATLDPAVPPSQISHADVAADCLEATLADNTASSCQLSSDDEITEAMISLSNAAAFVPPGTAFWGRLEKWVAASSGLGIDPAHPIQRNSAEGLGALARNILYKHAASDKVPAAPEAFYFPGLPPEGTEPTPAPVTRTVTGTTAAAYWQCLGVYALPGRAVTVSVPQAVVDAGGAALHIGGWTDQLYKKTQWKRLPEMVRRFLVVGRETKIASAFGGLVYLTLPAGLELGPVQVQVAGAILAAQYVEGVSDPQDWAAQLARAAPWGEISSSKLAIASPMYALTGVADPSQVTAYWDKIQDSNALLAGIDPDRPAPMRFQHDLDISGGYMHSGYPIMTYMDVTAATVDPGAAATHWAHLHELGHNHQQDVWTWEAVREVTCNFFAARAMWAVGGFTDPSSFYGWNGGDVGKRQARRAAYFSEGPSYAALSASPDLLLDSYLQVIEDGGYGFKLLRDTIAAYKGLSPGDRPASDDARLQTWVRLQSGAAGANLAPYYRKWGWPVSEATRAALAGQGLPLYNATKFPV